MSYTDLNTPSAATVAALDASNTRDLATLRETSVPALRDALLTMRAGLQAIVDDPRLSVEARQTDTAAVRSSAASAIEAIEGKANDAAGAIEARLDKATAGPAGVQKQVLDELQEQRAWARAKTAIDAGDDILTVVLDAGTRRDFLALRAMRDELPAYMQALRYDRQLQRAIMGALDAAEGPTLGPVEAYARTVRAELAVGMKRLGQSVGFAKHEAAGSDAYGYLNGWDGRAIAVAEQGPR